MNSCEGTAASGADASPGNETMAGDFIAAEYLSRADLADRHERLARMATEVVVPRLALLHAETAFGPPLCGSDIDDLAHHLLGPDLDTAIAYVTTFRDRGMSMDALFVGLLEPAARHLGAMWERNECDFIDVALGLGRLQRLLAVFNCTHSLPMMDRHRRVLTATAPGDMHFFGVSMVNKFLAAGGWSVDTELGASADRVAAAAADQWYAVVGFTLGAERNLGALKDLVGSVRAQSRNPAVGVMVGGPVFTEYPHLAAEIGADATAPDAPTAVLLAQKLFDIGALAGWREGARAQA